MHLSEIMNLPVIDLSGRIISETIGWIMAEYKGNMGEQPRLSCLLVKPRAWHENAARLDFGAITGISRHAVMVNGPGAIGRLGGEEAAGTTGMGAQVFTPAGEFLGSVADIAINDRGQILSLLLDSGKALPASRLLSLGDVAIVSAEDGLCLFSAASDCITVPSSVSNAVTLRRVSL